MCGIAGIITKIGQAPSATILNQMVALQKHRGPDDEGIFCQDPLTLGHCRLAIIDTSPNGHQPLTAFGLTITYNGEIYNYLELKLELEKQGFSFSTQTDTEVILAAYRCWGTACVQRFNGMWSFALYDAQQQYCFFSRDRFGEKPFYYINTNSVFAFASEIKAFRALNFSLQPNKKSVEKYLVTEKSEFFQETFFEGVYKLPAGFNGYYQLNTHRYREERYYQLPTLDTYQKISLPDAIASFSKLFEASVRIRMRSDVKLGSCLSGGLDSSAIVCHATKLSKGSPEPFNTITASFAGEKTDETRFSKIVAAHCGAEQQFAKANKISLSFISNLLQTQEEPINTTSVIAQYWVMQKAAACNLKVLLDGQGGDEILLGYLPHIAWALNYAPGFQPKLYLNTMRRNTLSASELAKLYYYHTNPALKIRWQLRRWPNLSTATRHALLSENADFSTQWQQMNLFQKQSHELTQGSLPMLLRYEDKNAMAFGVETRLPFLDPELVEFCLNLPVELKFNQGWTKFLLRKYLEPKLPATIVYRTQKQGFEAPISLENEFVTLAKSELSKSSLLGNYLNKTAKHQLGQKQWFRIATILIWENQWLNA